MRLMHCSVMQYILINVFSIESHGNRIRKVSTIMYVSNIDDIVMNACIGALYGEEWN